MGMCEMGRCMLLLGIHSTMNNEDKDNENEGGRHVVWKCGFCVPVIDVRCQRSGQDLVRHSCKEDVTPVCCGTEMKDSWQ